MSTEMRSLANALRIKIWPEGVWSQDPSTLTKKIAYTVPISDGTNTVTNNKEELVSNELDGQKQQTAPRFGADNSTLPLSFEFRYSEYMDIMLQAALGSEFTNTYKATHLNANVSVTGSTMSITGAGDLTELGLEVKDEVNGVAGKYSLEFGASAGDNGAFTLVSVTATDLVFEEDLPTDHGDVTIKSFERTMKNGTGVCAVGCEQEYVNLNATNSFRGTKGSVLNSLSINKSVGDIDRVEADFLGNYVAGYENTKLDGFEIKDIPDVEQMAYIDGVFELDGNPLTVLQSLGVTINRNAEVINRCGSRDAFTITQGKFQIEFAYESAKTDNLFNDLFDNATTGEDKNKFTFKAKMMDARGNYYMFEAPFARITTTEESVGETRINSTGTIKCYANEAESADDSYTIKLTAYGAN